MPTRSVIIFLAAWFSLLIERNHADERPPTPPQSNQVRKADALVEIQLDDLPKPPDAIALLLKDGKVSFQAGRRGNEDRFALSDSNAAAKRRLAAETRFRFEYDFRSDSRWRITNRNGDRVLSINVNYQSIILRRMHDVWFRQRPATEGFWDSRLVRHELDHIRISTDPALRIRFEQLVRENVVIRQTIERGTKVDNDLVQEMVKQQVQQAFDQMVDLVRIRYEELDRVTDHGLKAVPDDSSLWRWLR